MADAIIGGVLNSSLISPDRIIVSDPNSQARSRLLGKHGLPDVNVFCENTEITRRADTVVLSVKPQTLTVIMEEIHGTFRPNGIALSIVAGATIDTLEKGCGTSAVVRVMPNTPAAVQRSASVWTARDGSLTEEQTDRVRMLLCGFGSELFLADEDYVDMATALSGTGPAYFMLVAEAMIEAGVHMGLPRDTARLMVLNTMEGTAALSTSSPEHLARLRNDITSPGGTTAAAMYAAEKGGLRACLSDAVWRALEMGGHSSNVGPGRTRR